MTREEIEKISAVEPYCFETDREERWYEIGCIDGLKAADAEPNLESIWHDVSEEPKINEDVVLYDCCGNFVTEFYNGDVTWNNIVLFHKATMWAYKDDLLPKGGEV